MQASCHRDRKQFDLKADLLRTSPQIHSVCKLPAKQIAFPMIGLRRESRQHVLTSTDLGACRLVMNPVLGRAYVQFG